MSLPSITDNSLCTLVENGVKIFINKYFDHFLQGGWVNLYPFLPHPLCASSMLTLWRHQCLSLNFYLWKWKKDAENNQDSDGVEPMQVEHEVVGQDVFRGKQFVANQIQIVYQRQSHLFRIVLVNFRNWWNFLIMTECSFFTENWFALN